jgi:hypothetical protein
MVDGEAIAPRLQRGQRRLQLVRGDGQNSQIDVLEADVQSRAESSAVDDEHAGRDVRMRAGDRELLGLSSRRERQAGAERQDMAHKPAVRSGPK